MGGMADAVVLAFAGGAFPRAVGVAEEDLELEVGGEGLVLGHFLVLVVGEALAQDARQGREFALEGLAHAGGVLLRQVAEEGVAAHLPAVQWKLQNLTRLKTVCPAKFRAQAEELHLRWA